MSDLFGKTTDALAAAIQFRSLKQGVHNTNIANAETPGFKAKKLDFEQALSRAVDINDLGAMSVEHEEHFPMNGSAISNVRADVYENPDIPMSNDGNTVDLEREMSELAENSIIYKAAIQLINKRLAGIAYAIEEGR